MPIESYFRDRILISSNTVAPVFPVFDYEVGYQAMVKDDKPRYSTVGHYLYNRELIELSEDNNHLWITPLLDVSAGKDLVHDSLSRISQNTRGVRMEGSFNNRVFFSTSFYENQAVLPDYAAKYASGRGEFYPQADSSYMQQNAVISSAARTKLFKTNGFDYAYSVGFVAIRLRDNMNISIGKQFVVCRKRLQKYALERQFSWSNERELQMGYFSEMVVPGSTYARNEHVAQDWRSER